MKIRNDIKAVGLKATPQRRAVYEVVRELCHCSIDEIIAKVREQNPEVTVSTVYRIMDSFCEAGLLSKFNGADGKAVFDVTAHEHHHIFTANAEVLDLDDDNLSDMIKERIREKVPANEMVDKITIHITTKFKPDKVEE